MKIEELNNLVVTYKGKVYRVNDNIEVSYLGGDCIEVVFYADPVEKVKEENNQMKLFEESDCTACEG